jgi:hypothetical protein
MCSLNAPSIFCKVRQAIVLALETAPNPIYQRALKGHAALPDYFDT